MIYRLRDSRSVKSSGVSAKPAVETTGWELLYNKVCGKQ